MRQFFVIFRNRIVLLYSDEGLADDFKGVFELVEGLGEGVGMISWGKGGEEEHFIEVSGDDALLVDASI